MALGSPDGIARALGSSRCLSVSFDGGTGAPSAGSVYRMHLPYSCVIESATMVSDVAGSAVVDIWLASYPTIPSVANSIVASAKPTLSGQQVSQNTTLTGWTTSIPANSFLFFYLDSASTLTSFTLTLRVGA